jgi:hypothetical protein
MPLHKRPETHFVLGGLASLTLLFVTGCALALEGAEIGELGAASTGGEALAPATGEAVAGASAAEGEEILADLRASDLPAELKVGPNGDILAGLIDGNQKFSVDWSQGLIRNMKGDVIASIEGNLIYGKGSQGVGAPIAEILDSQTLSPSTLYSDATVKSTVLRFLNSRESVQIVTTSNGWYQLRTADGMSGWAFAPPLRTFVVLYEGTKRQPIVYKTSPVQHELIDSALLAGSRIHQDIQQMLSSR